MNALLSLAVQKLTVFMPCFVNRSISPDAKRSTVLGRRSGPSLYWRNSNNRGAESESRFGLIRKDAERVEGGSTQCLASLNQILQAANNADHLVEQFEQSGQATTLSISSTGDSLDDRPQAV
jgi:hypothetical protein